MVFPFPARTAPLPWAEHAFVAVGCQCPYPQRPAGLDEPGAASTVTADDGTVVIFVDVPEHDEAPFPVGDCPSVGEYIVEFRHPERPTAVLITDGLNTGTIKQVLSEPEIGAATARTGQNLLGFLHHVVLDPRAWAQAPAWAQPAKENPGSAPVDWLALWAPLGFTYADAAPYLAAGLVRATDLDYWITEGEGVFTPEDILRWRPHFDDAAIAAAYHRMGVAPEDAAPWESAGLCPETAIDLRDRGWTPRAAEIVRRHIEATETNATFARYGYQREVFLGDRHVLAFADRVAGSPLSPGQAASCVAAGFTLDEAISQGEQGILDLDGIRVIASLR